MTHDAIDKPIGIYVHWPYCAQKCPYCDFASQAVSDPPASRYASAIRAEFDVRLREFSGHRLVSVYFGGGTPSLMPPREIGAILSHMANRVAIHETEITVEVNPSSALPDFLSKIRQLGANRLSIGVQSTHDPILAFLGRAHRGHDSVQAIELARKSGFQNISVDLILASAPSSLELLEADLRAILAHRPEHISAYCLTIEEETPFALRTAGGETLTLGDDDALSQLEFTRDYLLEAGYEHYEISNFALPGFRAVHNSLYWAGSPYVGLGASAHSYKIDADGRHCRCANASMPESYMNGIERGEKPLSFEETLTDTQRAIECVMTALRRTEGLGETEFHQRTGLALRPLFGETIAQMVSRGLCEWTADPDQTFRLRLTSGGWAVADTVFLEFARSIS